MNGKDIFKIILSLMFILMFFIGGYILTNSLDFSLVKLADLRGVKTNGDLFSKTDILKSYTNKATSILTATISTYKNLGIILMLSGAVGSFFSLRACIK